MLFSMIKTAYAASTPVRRIFSYIRTLYRGAKGEFIGGNSIFCAHTYRTDIHVRPQKVVMLEDGR